MYLNKEVKVGLLTISALLIIYLGFNFLKGREVFAKTNSYYAIYSNAQGLNDSSKILLNGCPVGKVQSVEILPDKGYSVLVGFSIGKHVQVTDKTVAKLVTTNLLGNKVIELLIKEGNPLHHRDTIQSQVEQDLQALFLESTLPTLQDAKAISELTNRFMKNLVDNTDRINSIFTNLETAAQKMQEAISGNQKDLNNISKNITEITDALSDQELGIRPLLTRLNQLTEEINNMRLGDMKRKVDRILVNFGDGSLPKNMNQALISLDNLLVDFRQQPSRYIHFSIFGRKQIKLTPKKTATIQIANQGEEK